MEDPAYKTGLLKIIQAGLQEGRREFGFSWYGTHDELLNWLHNTFLLRHQVSTFMKDPGMYYLFFEDVGDFSNKSVNRVTPSVTLIGHKKEGDER
jgi:hypothetical protein